MQREHELLALAKLAEQSDELTAQTELLADQETQIDIQRRQLKAQTIQIKELSTLTGQLETDMNKNFVSCKLSAVALGCTQYFPFKFRGFRTTLNLCFELK